MDPLTNLKEQRELAKRLLQAHDTDVYPDDMDLAEDAARLAELVLALDAWRCNGGFDPHKP